MPSVIVSVKLRGERQEYDLEVPVDVPARKLAELITHNLDPQAITKGALLVRCLKPGSIRMLPPDVTLAGAGLWDGVLLEIGPANTVAPSTWADILLEWVPLELDAPEPPKPAPAAPPPHKAHSAQASVNSAPAGDVQFDSFLTEDERASLGLAGDAGAGGAAEQGDHEPLS